MPKPMTPSERLVGRRLVPLPKHLDTIMASFIKEDGTTCGRMEPADSWLRPAHKQARKNGWIRQGWALGFGKGKSAGIFYLTEAGEVAAREARARVNEIQAARKAWGRDFTAAHRARLAQAQVAEVPADVTEP